MKNMTAGYEPTQAWIDAQTWTCCCGTSDSAPDWLGDCRGCKRPIIAVMIARRERRDLNLGG